MSNETLYPILPLRDIVMFPGMVVPLFVGREKSVKAIEKVAGENSKILLVTQKDASIDDPKSSDIYNVGVLGSILQLLHLPDGTLKVLVEAHQRMHITKFSDQDDAFQGYAREITESNQNNLDTNILVKTLINQFEQYSKLNKRVNPDVTALLAKIEDSSKLADMVSVHLLVNVAEKQKILEELDIAKRLELLVSSIELEIGMLNTEKKIRGRVKKQMEKTQKEYYLNEQLKAIQKELGDGDDKSELIELEKKIKKIDLSKEAREKATSELKKLRSMNAMSAEATIIRNYLDWLLALPWGKKTSKIKTNIKKAHKALDKEHYGLKKVKERILEYLAVQERTQSLKAPILCLVGPPGVGKTSLAKSIAEATGREFVKFSLGGMRDEAEIRGHRRTYIGAMPGKIIQSLKKVKTKSPVFLLDEIDKMGQDYRGDPASALLEVLDPEQNAKFVDHYLEVEYDLSDVMFIATANSFNMPKPLLDRMEIIKLSGYTEDEKVTIATDHLIPKMKQEHGLKEGEWSIAPNALRDLVRYYTREAGVRNLEREIANLTRKAVKEILEETSSSVEVTVKNLNKYAGVHKYTYGEMEENDLPGVTTGLAYTDTGGDILSIEAVSIPGKGGIKMTGKLGDVMQESVSAAFSYFRSKSLEFGVTPPQYQKKDIHVHVPEGATPKDGPSAGVAIFTSIASIMTGVPVKKTVAMTGEITLRGRVLAIGGLKEKLLAALRAGIKTVLIPHENVKDLEEIPENVKKDLEIIPINFASEALPIALTKPVEKVEWVEIDNISTISPEKKLNEVLTH